MIDHAKLEEWRERADDYDRRAALIRRDGDPAYAEELEAVAVDLRIACDELAATADVGLLELGPYLFVGELSGRVYLAHARRVRPDGTGEVVGIKQDVTNQVGRVIARLDELGLELRPVSPATPAEA